VTDLEEQAEKRKRETAIENHERAEKLREEIRQIEENEKIRAARSLRVTAEPDVLTEDSTVVFIQHMTLGKIRRIFRPSDRVQMIYDWVGSLSLTPKHFKLTRPFSHTHILPDEIISKLDRDVLSMIESNDPIEIGLDETVTFMGHHQNYQDLFQEMENKRLEKLTSLNPDSKILEVSRDGIFDDLMKAFSKRICHTISVKFVEEDAYGDGVAREAYSLFMDHLLFKTCEGRSQFVPQIHPEFSEDEYQTVGKIFYHFYINFGVFPIQLAKASLETVFVGSCRESVLMESFFSFISSNEARILQNAINHQTFIREEITNILSVYGVRTIPTKDNLAELVCRISKNILVTKPWQALMSIKQAFGTFFDGCNKESISAIFEIASPSSTKILEHIIFPDAAIDEMEENTFQFMRRFIEEADESTLKKFLQYVTGCTLILPGLRIGITTQIMNELEMRPISKVCIKMLILPKNIPTFHQFSQLMDYYFNHNELWAMED